MQPDREWNAAAVGEALVSAFRRLPSHPVMSRGRRPGFDEHSGGEVQPFGWPERFLPELQHRRIVLTWARCMATGESVRDRYDQLQWPRSSTERRRAAALAAIAAGLNAEPRQTGS